ncbi:MAG: hypothetical protein AB4057_00165 [Crocosphaera sp.]
MSPQTSWGQQTEKILEYIWEPLDLIGQKLLGSLWKTFYCSVQDAIALSLLLQIPSLIGRIIIGKAFSSYDVCLAENALGSSRYACFIIVTSDFLLWVILAGRILGRFILEFRSLWSNNNRGNNNESPES